MTLAEKFSLAGEMIVRGLGTVFLVLIILLAVIAIFGAVANSATKRKEKKALSAPVEASAPATDSAPAEDSGAIVAAIMAAIEAFRAEEGLPAGSYRVVSFKKRGTKKARSLED